MNKINEIMKLNQMELDRDLPFEQSWHQTYKNCPWIYFGGISTDLSEGDIICLFSQYTVRLKSVIPRWGEVEDINLVRDQDTGKSKGFGFLRYEDWLSTVLAVDNFNGMEVRLLDIIVTELAFGKNNLRRSQEGLSTSEKGRRGGGEIKG